jgi:hypothetical protein
MGNVPFHSHGEYQVVNKVQVLDPPHAIGWLTGQEKGESPGVRAAGSGITT